MYAACTSICEPQSMNKPSIEQLEQRRRAFRDLHHLDTAFLMPNPWDAGTAKLLAHLGFQAIATTSAGFAFAQGLPDNGVGRELMFRHVGEIVAATSLPVSADLENGYGDDPDTVAETIRLALGSGLAGASIEDARGKPDSDIYPISLAVERIQAAVETIRAQKSHFVLTARAENFLCGNPDINDTIKRLQAFQDAGADVLFAPGITQKEHIAAIVSSLDRPVNVVMGLHKSPLTVADLSAMGVKRISVGGRLTQVAFAAVKNAALEMLNHGTFNFVEHAMPFSELQEMMASQK